jgi:hypothetical protein
MKRNEKLIRRACKVMGWTYHRTHVYSIMRKVGLQEAVAISLDKLEEMLNRLEADNPTEALHQGTERRHC